jgi:large subunit ribosomal protein L13
LLVQKRKGIAAEWWKFGDGGVGSRRFGSAATFEKRHLLLYWRNTVKTYYAKPNEVEREWLLIDAEDQVLGRVASKAAQILKGKHKPQYTPHVDTGDFVVVINADKIRVTGVKATDKEYYRHSGYPGGLKCETFQEAMEKHPERVIEHAVKGMLPKNTLGRAMAKKLKVYAGSEHPHMAQQPREIKMEDN